ncbi:MAG: ribosome biogenesis GTPase YlqF [Bacilli bacterium]
MVIQWFPGHMAKARRQITEQLSKIDCVLEIVDARLPRSSRNPMLDEILGNKPRIILLNKSDLADPSITKEWLAYYHDEVTRSLAIDAKEGVGLNEISKLAHELMKPAHDKLIEKGVTPRAIRLLVVGIPNVGKSTLINRMCGKNIAKTGDRPGVTTAQQWIKVGKQLELLDTPGILWPKFEDQRVGMRLAATGAIKDSILHLDDITIYALRYLEEHYPAALKERYGFDDIPEDIVELLDAIGRKRGALAPGGFINYEKVYEIVLQDLRSGRLGRVTLESPNDEPEQEETEETEVYPER